MAENASSKAADNPAFPEVAFTRVLNAPRELVWKAWTDPKHFAVWWGPRGFTNPRCELDVRPGGAIRVDMRAPDGIIYPMGGAFQEVVEPERLVFTSTALDKAGNALFENLNTVTFEAQGDKTIVKLHARVVKATPEAMQYLAGMEEGWSLTLDRLEAHVAVEDAKNQTMMFTRVFDAPRALVWKAWTDPKHLGQWWGPKGYTNPRCEMDARPGGAINIDMRGPDGTVYPITGTIREIQEPERLVFTERIVFPSGPWGEPGKEVFELLNTVSFEEKDSMTTVRIRTCVIDSTPGIAPYIRGSKQGWLEMLERLETYLATA